MHCRNLLAAFMLACLTSTGLTGLTTEAKAGYRGDGSKVILPIAPSYRFYDFPYYYSRGHYSTHITGYVYNGFYTKPAAAPYAKAGNRCSKWHRACVTNWGAYNSNYYGCMNYHNCD